jgi:ABC-2 type transport system ATP-binding protein
MRSIALRCEDLVKCYEDVTAVDGLTLEVRRGECFGLLGPNGAGKTTTVEIFEGLLTPDSGSVEVLGESWRRNARHLRERLGVQLQETRLIEKLTVMETLTLFRSFYRRGTEPREVLALVGLQEKSDSWVRKLSGGQHQRLSLACALVGRPEVLFLDEPTTGLDPQSRRKIWKVVREFRARGGTVLLTTHYMEEAERLCDRVAIIDHGRVIAQGAPAALIASLEGEHVIEFQVEQLAGAEAGRSTRPDRPAGDLLDRAALQALDAVREVHEENGVVRLTVHEVHRAVPELLAELARQQVSLSRLATHHATLEDVFVHITGRHLRDN